LLADCSIQHSVSGIVALSSLWQIWNSAEVIQMLAGCSVQHSV
jgi:hypothetical protein